MGSVRSVMVATAVVLAMTATFARAGTCPPADPKSVVAAMSGTYGAMMAHDSAAVSASFTSDFYAFDGGKRYDGAALPKLIADTQASGKTYVWSVRNPDVHITCDRATIAYVNVGSVTAAAGTIPRTWLESAILRFEEGRWRIEFLHSTRVAPAP